MPISRNGGLIPETHSCRRSEDQVPQKLQRQVVLDTILILPNQTPNVTWEEGTNVPETSETSLVAVRENSIQIGLRNFPGPRGFQVKVCEMFIVLADVILVCQTNEKRMFVQDVLLVCVGFPSAMFLGDSGDCTPDQNLFHIHFFSIKMPTKNLEGPPSPLQFLEVGFQFGGRGGDHIAPLSNHILQ